MEEIVPAVCDENVGTVCTVPIYIFIAHESIPTSSRARHKAESSTASSAIEDFGSILRVHLFTTFLTTVPLSVSILKK